MVEEEQSLFFWLVVFTIIFVVLSVLVAYIHVVLRPNKMYSRANLLTVNIFLSVLSLLSLVGITYVINSLNEIQDNYRNCKSVVSHKHERTILSETL